MEQCNYMGRKDTLWNTRNGTYIETVKPTGYDVLINGIDKYLNFNDVSGSSGYGIRDNGGTMEFKNSGGAWTGFGSGGGGVGPGTINEIAYFDTTTTVNSLPVATYPSLTELSYVKGVTSAIQTQFTGKANTALSNLAGVAINTSLISDTTKTDDLGSSTIKWRNTHTENVYADTIGYNSLRAVFGERRIYINEFTDALWRADKRFTVTQSGSGTLSNLFDGDFESNLTVPVSTTNVINIYVENQSGVPVNGFTYPQGKIYVHFYYTNNNYSAISMRAKQGGTWYSLGSPTDISIVAGDKVLEFEVSSLNYLTDIELTVTTNGSDQVLITAVNYVMDRWTSQAEVPYFDKFSASNNILGNVYFRTVSQTTSANINADGDWYMGMGGTGGRFGFGITSPSAKAHILATTEQLRVGYDASNYMSLTVGASGTATFNLTGTNPRFSFSDPLDDNTVIEADSATASTSVLSLSGGSVGFSGANDAGTAYSLIFTGCSYQTSIKQNTGAKIEMAKENTWNYADTPTGIKGTLNFYTSSGTPDSPTLTKQMSINSAGLITTTAGMYVGTTMELGHASDTTLSRSSAGVLAVEGVVIPSVSSTNTLTNKRITKRVVTTTDDATAEIDVDVTDDYELTAIANNTTFTVTGTPTDGQTLFIRLKDAGVSKTLTWTMSGGVIGVTLPTATTAGKWHIIGFKYFTSTTSWKAIAVGEEA